LRPRRRRLRQSFRERRHQSTIPIALLKKPFTPKRLTHDPIQHERIDKWANWFH
jgi:hypothetical protein